MQISGAAALRCFILSLYSEFQFPSTSAAPESDLCFFHLAPSILGFPRLWRSLLREPGDLGTVSGPVTREVTDKQEETCTPLCPFRPSWGNQLPVPNTPLAKTISILVSSPTHPLLTKTISILVSSKQENSTRGVSGKGGIGGALVPPSSPLTLPSYCLGILW